MRCIVCLAAVCLFAFPTVSNAQQRALGHTVRWDLVQIVQGTAVAGGVDVARDGATGDTFTLTGSGDAEPAEGAANGGGTIVHHFAATGIESRWRLRRDWFLRLGTGRRAAALRGRNW